MLLLIYIASGAAVTLLILGVYWLQPEKMEKMYYRGDQNQTTLITKIRPLIKFLAAFNQKLNIENLDPGIYFMRLSDSDGANVLRFSKQ